VSARLAFAVLVLVLLWGLAAATLALARTPVPTATATVQPSDLPSATLTATALTATPTPFVTPVGCGFFAYTPTPGEAPPSNPTAPGAPAAPSDLRAGLVNDPELASGFAVRLMWQDNADNETCFGVAERIRGQLVGVIGLSPGLAGWATGPKSVEDIPDEVGLHCYQVYYGNAAGLSYSNEACVNVEVLPVRLEPTPLPPSVPSGCDSVSVEPPQAPDPPSGFALSVRSDPGLPPLYYIDFTWDDNSTNEGCFEVEFTKGDGAWYAWARAGPDQTAFNDGSAYTDLPGMAGWCFHVLAVNGWGRSEPSNEACLALPPTLSLTPSPTTSPTPSPTPSPTGSPTAACGGEGPVGAPGAPNAPTELQAMLSSGSNVCEGFTVKLRWNDNAADELCYAIERKVGEGDWAFYESGSPESPVSTGTVSVEDIPQRVGVHCYRVYYGNEAGRSAYSDEACVSVEVVPRIETSTPLLSPTPTPTRPPGCNLDGPVGSPQAPTAPSNLRVALRDEPGLPQPAFVDFTWDDNSTDEACFILSFVGPDLITEVTGPDQTTFSMAAYAQRCGMAGHWCYRVSAANEWGISQSSNEVCLNIEWGPAATPAATAAAAEAAVGELPTTSSATDSGGLGWWWWALTACGAVLMGLAALGLIRAGRSKP
jgi:hypothetical protein